VHNTAQAECTISQLSWPQQKLHHIAAAAAAAASASAPAAAAAAAAVSCSDELTFFRCDCGGSVWSVWSCDQ